MRSSILLILAILFAGHGLNAQTAPGIQISALFGSAGFDDGRKIIQTSDGGFLMAGIAPSNTGQVKGIIDSVQFPDYWLMKADSMGKFVWGRGLPGSGHGIISRLLESSNDYVIAGENIQANGLFSGNKNKLNYLTYGYVMFVNKATGAVTSVVYPGDTSNVSVVNDILEVAPGKGFILTGKRQENASKSDEIWIARLSNTGSVMWWKKYGSSNLEIGRSISPGKNNTYVLSGLTLGSDGDFASAPCTGTACTFLFVIDTSGNKVWVKSYDDIKYGDAIAAWQSNGGDYYVASQVDAFTSQTGTPASGFHGGSDYSIFKVSKATGNVLWSKCYGGSANDRFWNALKTADNGAILMGGTRSTDGDVGAHPGFSSIWLVRIDSNGTIKWKKNYGNADGVNGGDIALTCDNGYAVVGFALKTGGEVSGTFQGGGSDFWFIKLIDDGMQNKSCAAKPNSVASANSTRKSIVVYPNPATNKLTIEADDCEVTVYSIIGQALLRTSIRSGKQSIDIGKLPAGPYLLHALSKDGNINVLRFIKE